MAVPLETHGPDGAPAPRFDEAPGGHPPVRRVEDPPVNHSRLRYRRAALAAGASAVAKASSVLVVAVGVSLISRGYTAEDLGIWLLLIAAVNLLGFADLGLGNGVVTTIARASGRGDAQAARSAVSAALVLLTSVSIAIAVACAVIGPRVPWTTLLSVSAANGDQLTLALAVFAGCVLVTLPLSVSQRVELALQSGWKAHCWNTAGNAVSLAALVAATGARASLPVLTLAGLIGAPIAYLGNSVTLFAIDHRELRPRLRDVHPQAAARLLRTGSAFFVIAVTSALSYQMDALLISHFLGAGAVTAFAVPARLFSLVPLGLTLLVAPLWPAHAESLARADHAWAQRALRRSLVLSLTALPAAAMLALAARPIMSLWLGTDTAPSPALLATLASWAAVSSVGVPLSIFLYGAHIIRAPVVIAVAVAVINPLLSIVLVRRVGISGPVLASVISQCVLVLGPALLIVAPFLRARSSADAKRWLTRWTSDRLLGE